MFDLFRSRAKAVRYLLGGLLLLVALSMVVTLIPGYGTGGGREDQVVAEIGKDVLTASEVNRNIQAMLRNRTIPREIAASYVPQMVDQMITERALVYKAQQLGFKVTEDDVARLIRQIFPQLFQGGQFAGKDIYASMLAQQNTNIPEFEANVRKQILLVRMQGLAAEGVVVTPAEIEREYTRRNEKAKLEYIAFTPDKLRAEAQVPQADIEKYYQANRAQFTVPEKRNLSIVVIDEAKIAAGITVPDEELRRMYEQNKEQYRVPERVQVRHILLTTTGKPAQDVPKIEAHAEELLKELKGGADFGALAKKESQDPGSAPKGGDLGWIVRGQTVPEFEKAAFTLKPKELSGVIKTQYGFHILQVMAKEDARVKPFEEVKEQLAAERKKQQVYDTMQRLADQARAELSRDPKDAERIAAKLGLPLVKAQNVGAGDPLPEIGVSRELEDAFIGLAKGGVTPVVQTAQTKLAIAVVDDVLPSRPATLAEVEPQIRNQLSQLKLNILMDQRSREAVAKARAAGNDLAAAAKSYGLELKTTQDFPRTGAAEGIGSAGMLGDAFDKPVGTVFGPVAIGEQRFVCKVISRTPADLSQLAAQRDQIRDELKRTKQQERYQLFQDSIRASLVKSGKIKIHKDVVDRIAQAYQG